MPDQFHDRLGAYLDGELDRRSQAEVEAHLAVCHACRDELAELRKLTLLLHAAPEPEFTPAADFKAQVMLRLPRRQVEAPSHHGAQWMLWLAPLLVLGMWVFLQVTTGLFSVTSLANHAGLLDGIVTQTASSSQQTAWFSATQATLGGLLSPERQVDLKALNDIDVFAQGLVFQFLGQVVVAVLYWVAMALLWHYKIKALWMPTEAS